MEKEKDQASNNEEEEGEFFPPEIIEQAERDLLSSKEIFPENIERDFAAVLRKERPVPLDKLPLTPDNVELLTSARLYLEENYKLHQEMIAALKEREQRTGQKYHDVKRREVERRAYPPLTFLENSKLFVLATNCEADSGRVQKMRLDEVSESGNETRISYPAPPQSLPDYVGIYRELRPEETNTSLQEARDKLLRQIEKEKFRDMGIEPLEDEEEK